MAAASLNEIELEASKAEHNGRTQEMLFKLYIIIIIIIITL
jgi:hypothetical protein